LSVPFADADGGRRGLLPFLPPVEKCQPLEKLYILLDLQERAMQRRDEFAPVALLSVSASMSLIQSKSSYVTQ